MAFNTEVWGSHRTANYKGSQKNYLCLHHSNKGLRNNIKPTKLEYRYGKHVQNFKKKYLRSFYLYDENNLERYFNPQLGVSV